MTTIASGPAPLERLLAMFLQCGTWLACAMICAGIVSAADVHAAVSGATMLTAGVALFILLPVLRLLLMLAVFMRRRDYRYVAIAAAVLSIVAAGALLGVRLGPLAG
ncbi:DUF1634 domain-containing protein [Paraburkholderia phosphatilytica]|uniref:DUF1634 domain-containing protein n=1 Tax=Paraburkholderia phosphatilytica TaxID=2282883 RepID=UPI000E535FA7|nr:DUF1634 domain-containing protein [Paraburkholderia phosphatilytica]